MVFSIVKQPDKRERNRRMYAPTGVPTKRTRGGWLSDMVGLGKAIVLCGSCRRRYEEGLVRENYAASQAVPGYNSVIGDCDACPGKFVSGTLFVRQK